MSDSESRWFYVEIFLISFAVILLEISYTRIFSFKLYYFFTFLIIGMSLLGLGSGGVFVAMFPWLRRIPPTRVIASCALAASAAVTGGYFLIAPLSINAFAMFVEPVEALKLALILTLLFMPFLAAGVIIATIFGSRPSEINRLYCIDLLGAGLGCVCSIPLIYVITPPGCVMLSALVFAAASVPLVFRWSRAASMAAAVLMAVAVAPITMPKLLPDPLPDRSKTLGYFDLTQSPIVFSRWSSVFRVDVMEHPLLEGASYLINHDGQMGSGLHRFNGDLSTLSRFDKDPRLFPFRVLRPNPKVLIIGSAGGHEVLASLYFHADHVTGVELNPVTYSLLTEHFADYSGHLAENPKVTLVNAEGRSFLRKTDSKYDLIWFVAPDTYAAMNAATSGAFVLSESYLYTVEMLTESLDHLTDDGIICAMFGEAYFEEKPNRTARYISTAREALARRHFDDPRRHILLATSPSFLPLSTILVKKQAFTDAEIHEFVDAVDRVPGSQVQFADGRPAQSPPIRQIIDLPRDQLDAWYAQYPYAVTPVTDDSPFFWHFARFRGALSSSPFRREHWELEDNVGERLLVVLLGFVIVFAAVFLLLPFISIRSVWHAIPYKTHAAVYFGGLGTGFMFLEVSLIQMLTLFLGYPSYSLSVTLFSLLIFTGLGSLATVRYGGPRGRTLLTLFGILTGLVAFYQFGLSHVVDAFVGSSIAMRFAIAVALIAPLGLCLGAFMPIGLGAFAAVTEHRAEYIAWGWAVNGFFSVISSILSTILAMTVGFRIVLLCALVMYAVGIAMLARVPDVRAEAAEAARRRALA